MGPITPTVLSLRKELFTVPYHEINWDEARNLCAKVGQLDIYFTSIFNLLTRDLVFR